MVVRKRRTAASALSRSLKTRQAITADAALISAAASQLRLPSW
jgi:hypothetical protein